MSDILAEVSERAGAKCVCLEVPGRFGRMKEIIATFDDDSTLSASAETMGWAWKAFWDACDQMRYEEAYDDA